MIPILKNYRHLYKMAYTVSMGVVQRLHEIPITVDFGPLY